jgi:type II restriction enzyme
MQSFTLNEIYSFEKYLKMKHPENNNIQAKIRQQLQILRDKNYLEFVERGKYKIK